MSFANRARSSRSVAASVGRGGSTGAAVAGALVGAATGPAPAGGRTLALADDGSSAGPEVVYVHTPSRPLYYDPYYNQPKYIRPPQYYTESTSKKKKGNKVTTTKTIRNEYGQTVYKEKTTKTKKKKK